MRNPVFCLIGEKQSKHSDLPVVFSKTSSNNCIVYGWDILSRVWCFNSTLSPGFTHPNITFLIFIICVKDSCNIFYVELVLSVIKKYVWTYNTWNHLNLLQNELPMTRFWCAVCLENLILITSWSDK